MSEITGQYNQYFSNLIVEELLLNGVDYFILSPGSRSTPLTVAVADYSGMIPVTSCVVHDERAAAFHALGYARTAGRPAALICTSGTAVANYLPAVVEASMDMIPMILLTADRPPELHDCGANQTIDQAGIFGKFVRYDMDLPCPDDLRSPEYIISVITQAVSRANGRPHGPVHLNCRFREPFLADSSYDGESDSLDLRRISEANISTPHHQPLSSLPEETAMELSKKINDSGCGLIVAGQMRHNVERKAVENLTRKLDWPLLPDITSGLRLKNECPTSTPYYDLALNEKTALKADRPATVLHLGGRIISKRLMTFLKANNFDEYIHVADHPFRYDPMGLVTCRVECPIQQFCEDVIDLIHPEGRSDSTKKFMVLSETAEKEIEARLDSGKLTEPAVARLISQLKPEDHELFLANSLSVRLMDSFGEFRQGKTVIQPIPRCNRGASGIDGTIATACGLVAGSGRPTTLLVGDLAFLHDLNSLCMVKKLAEPLTIVLLNNDGGGIFSMLPIAERADLFDSFFRTTHGLKFTDSARQFGLGYTAVTTFSGFRQVYRDAVSSGESSIIECTTDSRMTAKIYQDIISAVWKA